MDTTTTPTPEETRKFFESMLKDAILPNAREIERIWIHSDVAILFWQMDKQSEDAARSCGWTGGNPEVRRMSPSKARQMADNLQRSHPHDPAIAWLRRRSPGRLFVFTGTGTLCLNSNDDGWAPEPGTLGITSN